MIVDNPTLLVVLSVVQVVTAAVIGLLYWLHRTVPGPRDWIIGKALLVVGWLLAFWAIPQSDEGAVTVARLTQQVGVLFLLAGYARFVGRPVPWRILMALPVLFLGLVLASTETETGVPMQAAAHFAVIALYAFFCAWVLLWRRPRHMLAQGAAGFLWAVITVVIAAGAIQAWRRMPASLEALWDGSLSGAISLMLVWAIIQAVFLAGAMAMMVADRLRNALDARILELDASRRIAEEAFREQRNFLAMVSHEFRSPLAMISASAAVIGSGLPPADQDAAEEVERIERVTARLANLVEGCLADDWMDSAANRPPLAACSLRESVAGVAAEQKVPVRWDLPGDVLVEADPQLLPVVFSCLIDNANKYGRDRRKTEVVCRPRAGDASWVEIAVHDDGPGLRSDDFAILTQKYRRAPQQQGVSGSGLGLYLARRVVDLHGGEIGVCGGGETGIVVALPMAPAVAQSSASEARHSCRGGDAALAVEG